MSCSSDAKKIAAGIGKTTGSPCLMDVANSAATNFGEEDKDANPPVKRPANQYSPSDDKADDCIHSEQNFARQVIELWLASQPEEAWDTLDRNCHRCTYVCKHAWRFAGLQGAMSKKWYYVGPLCPVIHRFSPLNEFARMNYGDLMARIKIQEK